MKQKHTFQRGVASVVLAGVVLMSGVPALAAGTPANTAEQSLIAVQSIHEEETPLSLEGQGAIAVQGNEEVPLNISEEETPLGLPDTPFFNFLSQLLELLGWKH